MAIDKKKIEKAAVKFTQKGQFKKAVSEYQKVLANDPKDIRVRLKLLDIYGKMGRKDEAVEECRRVSDTYVSQGFIPRAIAVWKQGLRIDPNNPELYKNIGELYLQQKLTGDAIAAFKTGVDLLIKKEFMEEANALLARMEELAPDNIAIKLLMAEINLEQENLEVFQSLVDKITDQLRGEGRLRKLLQLLEGLYEKSQQRIELVKPLASLYLELGEDDKALAIIHQGLSSVPGDRDLRLQSIRANLALGNLTDARKVALGIRDESPEDLFILEQLAAIAQARGDDDEMVQWHKEIAKVYGRKGDSAKEEYHYKKVLEKVPDDAEAIIAMGGPQGGEKPAGKGKGEPEVFEGSEEYFIGRDGFVAADQAPLVGEVEESEASDEIGEGLVEAELYVKYGLEEKALQKLKELVALAPNEIKARQMLRDICHRLGYRDQWLEEQLSIARLQREKGDDSEALRSYEAVLELFPDQEEATSALDQLRNEAQKQSAATSASEEMDIDQAIMQADVYIGDGETGEAMSILLRLQEKDPSDPRIIERLGTLGWTSPDASMIVEDEKSLLDTEDFRDIKEELGSLEFSAAGDIAGFEDVEVEEIDDIVNEFKSNLAGKLDESDFETHYDLGVAYKEMGLLEDALQEFQKAARFTEKAKNAYTSIAMIYRETAQYDDAQAALRLALSVPTNTDEDRAAILYELGAIAQESNDLEGALSSFEKAYEINPSLRDVSQRVLSLRNELE